MQTLFEKIDPMMNESGATPTFEALSFVFDGWSKSQQVAEMEPEHVACVTNEFVRAVCMLGSALDQVAQEKLANAVEIQENNPSEPDIKKAA